MDDNEFNIELKKLLKDASDKVTERNYCESIEQERKILVTAFYDHYATLSLFEGEASVENFLASLSLAEATPISDEADEDSSAVLLFDLDELIQKDIEKFSYLLDGEMQVTGEGMYLIIVEHEQRSQYNDDTELEILEKEETLTGDIKYYSVESMISYEAFIRTQHADDLDRPDYDDVPAEVPSLLLHMENVKIKDEAGMKIEIPGEVVVPLNYPSLQFGKIVRLDTPMSQETVAKQLTVDITQHFKSDLIARVYGEIEKNLNSGDIEGEALHALRAKYQAEAAIYMDDVDRNRKIVLTALNARTHNHKIIDITNQEIVYLDPVIMQLADKSWRVGHAVEFHVDEVVLLRHVLPEDIINIHYGIEE